MQPQKVFVFLVFCVCTGIFACGSADEERPTLEEITLSETEMDKLIARLYSSIVTVRRKAAAELAETGSVDAIPAFVRALSDPDEEVRRMAVDALSQMGKPAVPALIRVIERDMQPEKPETRVVRKPGHRFGEGELIVGWTGQLDAERFNPQIDDKPAPKPVTLPNQEPVPDPVDATLYAAQALGKMGATAENAVFILILGVENAIKNRYVAKVATFVRTLRQIGTRRALEAVTQFEERFPNLI